MECVVHNGKECSAGSDIIYLLVCHVPMEEIDYFVDAISPYDEGEDDNDTDDSELYDEDREGIKRMRGFKYLGTSSLKKFQDLQGGSGLKHVGDHPWVGG